MLSKIVISCVAAFPLQRGSHGQSVYPTQDTSHMGTARVKQEEEADTRIIAR